MSTRYIPALSFKWLTPLYDPLLKWVMREETFKRRLIQQANIQSNMRVLDLGCGTGTGFGEVQEAQNFVTIFGPLSLWRAVKGD